MLELSYFVVEAPVYRAIGSLESVAADITKDIKHPFGGGCPAPTFRGVKGIKPDQRQTRKQAVQLLITQWCIYVLRNHPNSPSHSASSGRGTALREQAVA